MTRIVWIDCSSTAPVREFSSQRRFQWSEERERLFINSVRKIGIHNATAKMVMDDMAIPGLTRSQVASHLQKYKLKYQKMQSSHSQNRLSLHYLLN